LSDVNDDNANEKKKLAAKDKEINSLRKQIRNMKGKTNSLSSLFLNTFIN
jgi:predicted RNase H-like nuclease (RuvC/YqgF family)